jgi:3-hydroxybutyryl-CoA dehydrogenase
MKIFILADEDQKKEIMSIHTPENTSVFFASGIEDFSNAKNYDACFILNDKKEMDWGKFNNKPVFVNSVIDTLVESGYPSNVARINAWPGFLERPLWEVAGNKKDKCEEIFYSLNRKAAVVKDEPGFVSARVISMIVNEAFFAFGENISTIEEIDKAMKLGTNYPEGPFEWAEKIGVANIYLLLKKLSEKEMRYRPAPALEKLYIEISERI